MRFVLLAVDGRLRVFEGLGEIDIGFRKIVRNVVQHSRARVGLEDLLQNGRAAFELSSFQIGETKWELRRGGTVHFRDGFQVGHSLWVPLLLNK